MLKIAQNERITCPDPGIYRGVAFAEYQRWDALNPSLVKVCRESMAAFHHYEWHPDYSDTPAMALGRAVHTCVLEPDEFVRRYVVWSDGRRAGGRWDAFCEANEGKGIIDDDDYRACCEMRDSVRTHPAARLLFTVPADIETCLVWDDPSSGLRCKGRFDYLGERLLDLKTTASLDERMIVGSVARYGYHISMAAYHDGYFHLTSKVVDPVLLFVSKRPPYECAVRPLSPEAVNRGVDIWRELLGKIAECRASGVYPGFMDAETPLYLPAWEMGDDDELELTMGGERI